VASVGNAGGSNGAAKGKNGGRQGNGNGNRQNATPPPQRNQNSNRPNSPRPNPGYPSRQSPNYAPRPNSNYAPRQNPGFSPRYGPPQEPSRQNYAPPNQTYASRVSAPQAQMGERPPLVCYRCGGRGHMARNCGTPDNRQRSVGNQQPLQDRSQYPPLPAPTPLYQPRQPVQGMASAPQSGGVVAFPQQAMAIQPSQTPAPNPGPSQGMVNAQPGPSHGFLNA